MRLTTLLAAICLLFAPRAADGQRLIDPFAGVRPRSDLGRILEPRDASADPRRAPVGRTPLERAAIRAAGLTEKGNDLWIAERTVGGRRLVFVRGWTGAGTGYVQIGTLAFVPAGRDSVRRVWWGIADEVADPGSIDGRRMPHWRIHGCLYVYGDGLIYVRSRPSPPDRGDETPPVPENGVYRWSERACGFVRTGPAPAAAWPRCRREPDLTGP